MRRLLVALLLLSVAACDISGPTVPGTSGYGTVTVDLVRRAAGQGDAGAETSLGHWYETGSNGLPKRPEEAARLYRLAADQGNVIAMTNLAVVYARGRVLAQDDREAVRLLKLATAQGDPFAGLYLAAFYVAGRGGLAPDDPQAIAGLRKVAARDMADGCRSGWAALALSYVDEAGEGGGKPDLDEAIRMAECGLRVAPLIYTSPLVAMSVEDSRKLKARDKELARLAALKARRDGSFTPAPESPPARP